MRAYYIVRFLQIAVTLYVIWRLFSATQVCQRTTLAHDTESIDCSPQKTSDLILSKTTQKPVDKIPLMPPKDEPVEKDMKDISASEAPKAEAKTGEKKVEEVVKKIESDASIPESLKADNKTEEVVPKAEQAPSVPEDPKMDKKEGKHVPEKDDSTSDLPAYEKYDKDQRRRLELMKRSNISLTDDNSAPRKKRSDDSSAESTDTKKELPVDDEFMNTGKKKDSPDPKKEIRSTVTEEPLPVQHSGPEEIHVPLAETTETVHDKIVVGIVEDVKETTKIPTKETTSEPKNLPKEATPTEIETTPTSIESTTPTAKPSENKPAPVVANEDKLDKKNKSEVSGWNDWNGVGKYWENVICLKVETTSFFGIGDRAFDQNIKGMCVVTLALFLILLWVVVGTTTIFTNIEPPSYVSDYFRNIVHILLWLIVFTAMLHINKGWDNNWDKASEGNFIPDYPEAWCCIQLTACLMVIGIVVECFIRDMLYGNLVLEKTYGSYDILEEAVVENEVQHVGTFGYSSVY